MRNTKHNTFFSSRLLQWFSAHKRDLPWRASGDPYAIWVSEIMLQQTRVETVIPYYERFMEKFPTLRDLAEAPEDEVLKAWEGLGYYSRARNLQSAVREVQEQYGGNVPSGKEEIASLKGVGPYTAGAILSIAWNKPEPAVDGNVMRVLSRFFHITDDVAKSKTRLAMEQLVRELIPEGQASDFNQGLMELGALVCTPRAPQCLTCPVMEQCAARIEGIELQLPVKKKAGAPRHENRLVALITGRGTQAGRILVRQRPARGLLARMWELPHVHVLDEAGNSDIAAGTVAGHDCDMGIAEVSKGRGAQLLGALLAEQAGLGIGAARWFMDTSHTFSHIQWKLQVYTCELEIARSMHSGSGGQELSAAEGLTPEYHWIDARDLELYAFPNAFLRIINQYFSLVG